MTGMLFKDTTNLSNVNKMLVERNLGFVTMVRRYEAEIERVGNSMEGREGGMRKKK